DGISVLLGNGDGTFRAPQTYATGVSFSSLSLGDFNRDGVPDLVAADNSSFYPSQDTVFVLLGNGDGSFRTGQSYTIINPDNGIVDEIGVAVADFNGDGNLDIGVSDGVDGRVRAMLGNGDGTFQIVTGV